MYTGPLCLIKVNTHTHTHTHTQPSLSPIKHTGELSFIKVYLDPEYVVKVCPWIIIKKSLIDTDITDLFFRRVCILRICSVHNQLSTDLYLASVMYMYICIYMNVSTCQTSYFRPAVIDTSGDL